MSKDKNPSPQQQSTALRVALETAMNDLKALTKAIRARGGPDLQDAGAAGEAAWKSIAKLLATPSPETMEVGST